MYSAKIEVTVSVFFIKEGKNTIVAYCPALELSSYGDSIEDAKNAFSDALEIFIEETWKKGTLITVLFDMGWALRKTPKPQFTPPLFKLSDIKKEFPPYLHPEIIKQTRTRIGIPLN